MLPRKIIAVYGNDSKNFLQGLITQDINKTDILTKETQYNAIYSALLTTKGRYNFDFFLVKITNELYIIDVHESLAEELLQQLNFYKLLAKVTCSIITHLKVFALTHKSNYLNSSLQDCTNFLTNSLAITKNQNIKTTTCQIVFQDVRLHKLGYRVITTNTLPESLTIEDYTVLLYENGVLEYPELIRGKSIPIQCGFDELNALCYNKGCYLGQEFTHSAKHKMFIRKRVVPCKLANISSQNLSSTLQPDSKITTIIEGKPAEVGYILSSFRNYAFVMLNIEYMKAKLYCKNLEIKIFIPSWLQYEKL